jgi:hypothetical protein
LGCSCCSQPSRTRGPSPLVPAAAAVAEEEDDAEEEDAANDEEVEGDDVRLRTWKRLIAGIPLELVAPTDAAFRGGTVEERRDAERLAFYGDTIINTSVVRAMYAQQTRAGGDATTLSLGEMSTLTAKAISNLHFARLLPRLLTPEMVSAVPANALAQGNQHSIHSMGTMVGLCTLESS